MATRRPKPVDPSLSAFATSDHSPFADRYDLTGERRILAPLLKSGDPDPADPLFGRYQLFLEREAALRQLQAEHSARQAADPIVPVSTARQINDLGSLEPGAEDTMTLHTAEAMRLFIGMSVAPDKPGYPMAGGRRVAAGLRALWSLSSNDNPYADWALIDISERVSAARSFIATELERLTAMIDALRNKGLACSIVQSRTPAAVRLGFTSPYGFMIAMLIVEFDFYARVVKSAQRRDLISSQESYALLQGAKHRCRSAFEKTLRYQRVLCTEVLIQLSRADFLPGGDEAAGKRVAAVRVALGPVPREIFLAQVQPRHTKRRLQLSEPELRLLNQVAMTNESEGASVSPGALVQ
ncbi:PFL_4669 family integrating conjugative element protein [Paraburkholderia tropica]|uniref:PFL_4669 family integrating conjugative element protein n=1 Tax=Paraburkholderia tropica TaxID=92647 RepID=UPI002AB6E87A|nr:TIGR03761 family integrating conjugative element protein [Paraburkholderia tropica]